MRKAIFLAMAVCLPVGVLAQAGGIRGTVMDADYEAPLPGVKVMVSETGQEVTTGDGGSYFLENLEPGNYTLMFSKSGYTRFTRTDVVVVSGQLAEVGVDLAGEYEEMDELVVRELKIGGESEIELLNLRMDNPALMDSIGTEQMKLAGASDAAQALTLVPGTTVQDGKYAVVRGLPDRYVSAQMNGVRLPTADVDKRAVQLDQFPSAMISSVQVSKTFMPDQQGDASGGAVNVVLKGIPDQPVMKASFGVEANSQVLEAGNRFLSSRGGGLNTWGLDANNREPQTVNTPWSGAVGTSRTSAPQDYKWGVTIGNKFEFDSGLKVGALGSFFYKRNSSYYENGVEDSYWVKTPGGAMSPVHTSMGEDPWYTKLYDTTQGSEELQWGMLGGFGIEFADQELSLLYSKTHAAEDSAVLQENTRGKYWFDPTYDINHPDHSTVGSSPFTRHQTLEYTERDTDTLQLRGTHFIPLPDWNAGDYFALLDPEIDWTVARSGSSLDSPDKRQFSSTWYPEYITPGLNLGWLVLPPTTNAAHYTEYAESANINLGNLQRIWKTVEEDSDQYFVNTKLPFTQWSNDEGFLKFGVFNDQVRREYRQNSFSNGKETFPTYEGDWSDYWTSAWESENHALNGSTVDIGYDGEQNISAYYYMLDLPLGKGIVLRGGARHEQTEVSTKVKAGVYGEKGPRWYPAPNYSSTILQPGAADVDFEQNDVLPALGMEWNLVDTLSLRAAYSETVARQTFKELTPVEQQEYLGADIFIGNPFLKMSALKNYDLRLDYNPYPGGLVSVSWFKKDIDQPIEYVQQLFGSFIGTTPVNYDEGQMDGFEFEVRQSLGEFWEPLKGINLGGNLTLINSSVSIPQVERNQMGNYGFVDRASRDMLNAPEYLYNLNATWSLERYGLDLGLFYSVKGDSLAAGAGISDGFLVPDVYETARGTLNFTASKTLGDHLKLMFKVKNLTDSPVEEVYRSPYQGDVIKQSYRKGLGFALEISGSF